MQEEYPRAGDIVEWRGAQGEELGLVLIGDNELKYRILKMSCPEEADTTEDLIGIALSGRWRGHLIQCDDDETMTVVHGHLHLNR